MPAWFASVDTAFILNLEQGSKAEIEAYERLKRAGHKIRFTPVVSHELLSFAGENCPAGVCARGFLAKMQIYQIDRLELDGPQKDFAKCAADKLTDGKFLKGNIAHLVAESACREDCFLISDLSALKRVRWATVQSILDGTQIHPIRRYTVHSYLRS